MHPGGEGEGSAQDVVEGCADDSGWGANVLARGLGLPGGGIAKSVSLEGGVCPDHVRGC